MKVKNTLLTLAVLGICCSYVQAQVTVAFGGDYVSTDQTSQANLNDESGVPTSSDSIRERGGFTLLANPTIGAGYSGPAFYGGAQVVKFGSTTANGLADVEIIQDAGGDYLNLFAQSPSGTTNSHLSYIFKMDASLNYDDLTGFSGQSAGGVSGSVVSRFMVEDTVGNYYVSDTSISGGNGGSTWAISDLSTEQWALFTPGADDWRGDYGSLTFDQDLSGTDLVSVGWFASRDSGTAGFTNSALTIREFEVTAVPEPSAYAALFGVLGLALVAWRRRK